VTGTLVLDCEGLSKVVLKDRATIALLAQARIDGVRVVASAATLVEARDPRMKQPRFDWAVSHLVVEPVTEDVAREASRLLAEHWLHGHQHAIDAMVAATALAAPAPRIVLTSDPRDITLLCGEGVRAVRV
jgi:predicted nucleic acid-binding protein